MQITRQHLIDWSACAGGREWFDANYPSGEGEYVAVQMALHRDGHRDYSNWLSWRVINNLPDACVAECAFGDALIAQMNADSEHIADDYSRNSSSGDDSGNSSSGNYSRNSSSGDDSRNSATGDNSVIASAGLNSTFMVGKGGCAAIAYYDGSRVRFAIAYEGENVRADVWYSVNDKGEFVEVPQ